MTVNTIIRRFGLSEKNTLAQKWQDLEQRADCSVFLSWLWIGNWLDLVKEPIYVIESYQGDNIVGLGFFVEKTRRVLGIYPVKQCWLHRTGNAKQDQIWIEYNDFLLDGQYEKVVRDEMVKALCHDKNSASIQEIVVGLSSPCVLKAFSRVFDQSRTVIASRGYSVDLEAIKHGYLQDILSKNTRSQLRRSHKLLNSQGTLSFRVVTNKQQILSLLPKIADAHIGRWQGSVEGSGFTNSVFTTFHQGLINNDESNVVQVAVLSLEDNDIGYLMNFVYDQQVYFYLSAITKTFDSKIKIGMTLHSEAIQYYLAQGLKIYDFLGGEARYKASLSNHGYDLNMVCFYKNHPVLRMEDLLRKAKALLPPYL